MKMLSADIDQLKNVITACRIADIDSVMITDNKVRGVSSTGKMAILTEVPFTFDPSIKLGIGRLSEFEKRLSIFATETIIEGKLNEKNEASLLTIASGKSKVQFRCTSERFIKYPKANEDPPACVVSATKAEINQLARAAKTLGAETLTMAIDKLGNVKFECSSPANETFISEINSKAEFVNDTESCVNIYSGSLMASVLDAAVRDCDSLGIVVGEYGSLTIQLKGLTILAMPESNQEEDDE